MKVGYEYQKSKNAVVAQTCNIPNTMQCQLLREIKDNHAIFQISQKSKYFYYFQGVWHIQYYLGYLEMK